MKYLNKIPKTLMESRISLFNYNYKERKQMKLKRHISEISQKKEEV